MGARKSASAGVRLASAALFTTLAFAGSVRAQTGLTTLYSFSGGADGATLYKGPTLDGAGNLYGSAFYGANACADSYQYANVGCGTVWKLVPGGTLTPLVTFTGAKNGADPDGNLTLYNKSLYGTTFAGGSANQGTVFKVTPAGTHFKTLYSFSGTDGEHPDSNPRFDSQGDLFSVAAYGGPAYSGSDDTGFGVLFEITSGGAFVSLHPFSGGSDGGEPSRIYFDSTGSTIYGTGQVGGSCSGSGLPAAGCGTLWSYVPQSGQFTVLYTFTGGADGYAPQLAGIAGGELYGDTPNGGANGYGTLFKFKPKKTGGFTYVHLYDFTGDSDGAYPSIPALTSKGEMIGGTERGPITQSGSGAGVLFDFKAGALTPLYAFTNGADGGYPYGTPVIAPSGTIYGTTGYGGTTPCDTSGGTLISSYGCGTVYQFIR